MFLIRETQVILLKLLYTEGKSNISCRLYGISFIKCILQNIIPIKQCSWYNIKISSEVEFVLVNLIAREYLTNKDNIHELKFHESKITTIPVSQLLFLMNCKYIYITMIKSQHHYLHLGVADCLLQWPKTEQVRHF